MVNKTSKQADIQNTTWGYFGKEICTNEQFENQETEYHFPFFSFVFLVFLNNQTEHKMRKYLQ